MYEHEKWDNPEDENHFIVKDLPKFSSYISLHLKISTTSSFQTVIYYQTGYDPNPGIMRNRFSYDIQYEIRKIKKIHFHIYKNNFIILNVNNKIQFSINLIFTSLHLKVLSITLQPLNTFEK